MRRDAVLHGRHWQSPPERPGCGALAIEHMMPVGGWGSTMDSVRFPALIAQLYSVVGELEAMFGRLFTPDGHMVGSIGEALAAHFYGLTLTSCSTKGCDATLGDKRIEIKATQGARVAFRCAPQHLLVLKIERDGSFDVVYNGDGARVWETVAHKPMPSNGQLSVSISTLKRLDALVPDSERIARVVT